MKEAALRIAGVLCAVAFALSSTSAAAQAFPTKPIRMVVPYPPGGTTDIVARPIASGLQEALGQPVVVENRPGAGGNIGMDLVAKAAPDGYTIAVSSVATLAIGASLYSHLTYDVLKDLAPVTRIAAVPNVLVVHPSVPANSVRELIAYAKANPGKLHFGSAGNGTTVHLSGELFKSMTGIDMQHIPYKGAAPAMVDLLGGRVQLMFDFLSSSLTEIKAKKLKALGVTGPKRSPLLPNVPTIAEAGVPGYEVYAAFGVLTTGGTPPAVVRKLNTEIVKLIATPGMKDILAKQGADPIGDSPEEFARSLKREVEKWASVVKASGARVE
jgi:tripartite-type tricarboxylate transporter receptor subunit TctC